MEKLRHCCALLGVATVSFGASVAYFAGRGGAADPSAGRPVPLAPKAASTQLASLRVMTTTKHFAKPTKKKVVVKKKKRVVLASHIGASPSLYEHTISVRALRRQGCAAGRARINGLVVLDFGKPEYSRRGGYGTITFGNRFASNTAITWAVQSYALGYQRCVPKNSNAHITLARGTSNYGLTLPSAYTAGRLWAQATVAIDQYLRLHQIDRVAAAAAVDAEPAWDRGFTRTYNFFRGYAHANHRKLLYNYGSLDGGAGAIWTVRQAYYVSGGMRDARAVPEIYNRAMAKEWAELARETMRRYGQPIKLAGLMTQHWTSCTRCGYTARKATSVLKAEFARARVGNVVSGRQLEAVTNIR